MDLELFTRAMDQKRGWKVEKSQAMWETLEADADIKRNTAGLAGATQLAIPGYYGSE